VGSLQGQGGRETEGKLIFPRYHQLASVRKSRDQVRVEGTGHHYLIQHTTGSGKSYEIGWLSHYLKKTISKGEIGEEEYIRP